MNIGERIRYLREKSRYSEGEFADKVGVSIDEVSKWENGQKIPSLEEVIIISELFEITTDYILKGVEISFVDGKNSIKTLYLGFILIFSIVLGIWSYSLNRFKYNEILFMILLGGIIGFGIALIVKLILDIILKRFK